MKCTWKVFILPSIIVCVIVYMFYQRQIILPNKQFLNNFGGFKNIIQPNGSWLTHKIADNRRQKIDKFLPNARSGIEISKTKEACKKNVLEIMKNGSWLPHKMTDIQRQQIEKFLVDARSGKGIPKTLQRLDKMCGNLQYLGQRGNFFRALCNPKGTTPCCENNKCVNKSEEECRCSNCLDERQSIHAEYSQWIPTDKTCSIHYYDSQEACKLLSGKTILIVGDSFMRHLYTGLLSFLRNNNQTGALERNPKPSILKECTGMYVYTEKLCRSHIDRNPKYICSGKVNVILKSHYTLSFSKEFKKDVDRITKSEPTLIVCGIGIHSQLQSQKIMNNFLMPVLNILKTRTKSKLVFATPHAPGLLKSPKLHQSLNVILKFISEMEFQLKKENIPIFDTVPMTKNIVSFDGSHYGLGLNRQKVQFLLNYIQELTDQGKW